MQIFDEIIDQDCSTPPEDYFQLNTQVTVPTNALMLSRFSAYHVFIFINLETLSKKEWRLIRYALFLVNPGWVPMIIASPRNKYKFY